MDDEKPTAPWIAWGAELAAMSQTGSFYARDPYDLERYRRMREIAFDLLAAGSGIPRERVTEIFEVERGHATPKVDVRAVVMRDGKILLVRERAEGRWSLPGGWADAGATPRENVEREVEEESGYVVRATRLLALYDKREHAHPPSAFYTYKVFLQCEIVGGAPHESDETDGVGFFSPDDLPPLSLSRNVPEQIARLVRLAADASLPAEFD